MLRSLFALDWRRQWWWQMCKLEQPPHGHSREARPSDQTNSVAIPCSEALSMRTKSAPQHGKGEGKPAHLARLQPSADEKRGVSILLASYLRKPTERKAWRAQKKTALQLFMIHVNPPLLGTTPGAPHATWRARIL